MKHIFISLLGAFFFTTACGAQPASTQETPAAARPIGPNQPSINTQAQHLEAEAKAMPNFEGLCRLTKDKHIEAPASGNRSTSSSNGTSITILGSKSQSISSYNGKALVMVSGAAVLHLEFPGGELVSVETHPSADKVKITINGPDAITCEAAT